MLGGELGEVRVPTCFISSESRTYIDPLLEMLAEATVVPAIDRRVSLADAVDAIRALDTGRTRGKSVIVLAGRE